MTTISGTTNKNTTQSLYKFTQNRGAFSKKPNNIFQHPLAFSKYPKNKNFKNKNYLTVNQQLNMVVKIIYSTMYCIVHY